MRDHDLPLFAWQPPCKLIAFPMTSRVGKIRDVAAKLLDKQTDRHAEWYRKQVSDGLRSQFEKIGLSDGEVHLQISAFWVKVDDEMVRLCYRGTGSNDPRGTA